jgi:hypothetical protein
MAVVPVPSFDVNDEGTIDLFDFALLQRCFSGPKEEPDISECNTTDVDLDSDVDLADFRVFHEEFTLP